MSESQYHAAYEAGYRLGLGDGRREAADECARKSRDEFWCGTALALASWPVAATVYLLWRVLS